MKTKIVFRLLLTFLFTATAMGKGFADASAPSIASSQAFDPNQFVQNIPWYIETIQPGSNLDTEANASIAYTDDNSPYISYYDGINGDLMLASRAVQNGNCGPNNLWFCRAVDRTGDVGRYNSLAIRGPESSMQVSIAYYDATHQALKYAQANCSPACKWAFTIIDDPASPDEAGRYASLKLDSVGRPHIAYNVRHTNITPLGNYSSLHYASYVGTGGNCGQSRWMCETIAGYYLVTTFGAHASLDFNGQDQPRIAYFDSFIGRINIAVYQGEFGNPCGDTDQWKCYAVDDVFASDFQSLYIGKTLPEKPIIAYYDQSNHQLKYASLQQNGGNCGPLVNGNQVWKCDVIDTTGGFLPEAGTVIARDSAGFPIIGYFSLSDQQAALQLKIARPIEALGLSAGNCGPQIAAINIWECDVVDNHLAASGNTIEGVNISVGVKPTGFASLVYQTINSDKTGALKYADQHVLLFLPLIFK